MALNIPAEQPSDLPSEEGPRYCGVRNRPRDWLHLHERSYRFLPCNVTFVRQQDLLRLKMLVDKVAGREPGGKHP